jgi:putative PEP-CTERM system TPR-repeat lipoprotein
MKTFLRLHVLAFACAATLTVVGLAGCGGNDPSSFLVSAKSYIAKRDYRAAIIELKNALQKDPDNGEARYLLARTLLDSGDAVAAETEIRKAITLKVADDDTYPLLAKAIAAQGEFSRAIKETGSIKLQRPDARADLQASLATAYLAQGDVPGARAAIDAALADQPTNSRALLLRSRLMAASGDLPGARAAVDAALKATPNDVDALLVRAELEAGEGRDADAQKTLQQAVDANPRSIPPRLLLLSYALRAGKIGDAREQVTKLKEVASNDVRTIYGEALVAFSEGDNVHARDLIQRVLSATPGHLPSLLMSGLINLQLGSYAAAEEVLRKVMAAVPQDPSTRRALAVLYIRTGRPQQAIDTLTPAIRSAPNNPLLLRTAGEAYIALGDATNAMKSYERANEIDKGNMTSEVRLAQVRFAAGDTARSLNDLAALSERSQPSESQADVALYTEHLRMRQYDQALQVAQRIEKKQPNSGLGANLQGGVYLAKRDLRNARASFERSLKIQPDFFPPAYTLAVMDVREGRPQAARQRYERLLAKDPKNVQVLLALAELQGLTGEPPDKIKATIDRAVAGNPTSAKARMGQIAYLARLRDYGGAVDAARAALVAIPDNPQLMEMLAAGQLAKGDANQAVETFKQLSQLQPGNALVFVRLADAQAAAKDYPSAVDSARKALKINPDLGLAWAQLGKTYLLWNRPDEALAEARGLQKSQPDKALGYALEGEILSAQGRWNDAATVFEKGLTHQASPVLAARAYAMLLRAGRKDDAAALATNWIKQNPKDASIPTMLAEESQHANNIPAATAGYQRVLEIDPDNAVALNNLAWIMIENKDPKAVEYAERAHRLAPFNPSVLDTLGWAVTRSGDPKRGAELLRMAASLAPAQPEIRLHLGKALVETGDKAGAKKALADLSRLDKNSPIRIEAEKISASL